MSVIALLNQKGGVGKTTTTVNLAAALARAGKSVCILDVDPQAHSSTHLGVEPEPDQPSLYDVLTRSIPLVNVRREVENNLCLVPSSIDLAASEMELAGVVGREMILRDRLAEDSPVFDYILMDCPPSLGVLTINALTAATEVIVPLQPHFFALHGLGKLFETVQLVSKRLNPQLVIAGVAVCLYESGTRLSVEVVNDLESFLAESQKSGHQSPWQNAIVYRTRIRRNIKVAESASFGKSIFDYDESCHGAHDYKTFAREVIQQELPSTARKPTARAA